MTPARADDGRWRGSQRRIGLTGGIASGKSSVGRLLADRHQLPVLDADAYAREALAPGSSGARAVLQRYGAAVTADGDTATVDRRALGRLVFTDADERRWLEQLVHPLVAELGIGAVTTEARVLAATGITDNCSAPAALVPSVSSSGNACATRGSIPTYW